MVKSNIKSTVLKMLQEKQKIHSKTRNILYTELKTQMYMSDRSMSNSMVETLVASRSSMVRGIAQNFAPSSKATACPLGCRASDSQQHLLQCPPLLARLTAAEGEVRNSAEYDDIYRDSAPVPCSAAAPGSQGGPTAATLDPVLHVVCSQLEINDGYI